MPEKFFHPVSPAQLLKWIPEQFANLPMRKCICILEPWNEYLHNSLREYYFGFVLEPYCEDQGMGKIEAHEQFKDQLRELYGPEDGSDYHVFGHSSELSQRRREEFVRDIRSILFHQLNIPTEAWKDSD